MYTYNNTAGLTMKADMFTVNGPTQKYFHETNKHISLVGKTTGL